MSPRGVPKNKTPKKVEAVKEVKEEKKPTHHGVRLDEGPGKIKHLYGLKQGDEWYDIELKVGEILDEAAKHGMLVDTAGLAGRIEVITSQMNELQIRIDAEVKHPLKIGSTKELGIFLFEELGLKPLKTTISGANSCDDTVLNRYESIPVVSMIRKWKNRRCVLSYLTAFLVGANRTKDHRIRWEFLPWDCPTGRIYAKDVSVLQIPPEGRLFVIPDPDHEFLYIDYKQMEFRIMLSVAQEFEQFGFIEKGGDIHTLTASGIFNKLPNLVTPEEREIGKTINYAISYGGSANTISLETGKPVAQCQEFIDKFFQTYPKVAAWIDQTHKFAAANKFIHTIFGHKRDLAPEMKVDYQSAMRMAVNTQIQGASAGFLKMAIKNVAALKGLGIRFCVCVHDSLLLEVPKKLTKEMVEGHIRNAVEFQRKEWLPLAVDMTWSDSWGMAAHTDELKKM